MGLISSQSMTADNLPSPYVVSNTYEKGANPAYYAFDGNASTFSQMLLADNATFPQDIIVDLGAANGGTATSFDITQFGGNYCYKDFEFDGSNDNSTWTSLTSGTFSNDSSLHTFSFSNSVQYRYYRLHCTSSYNTGVDCPGVYSINIYGSRSSPSASVSPSASISPSASVSPSISPSSSISASISPSSSISPSHSISPSSSRSPSASMSPSPSPGFTDYTRQALLTLPGNDNDLATIYTEAEVILTESEGNQPTNDDDEDLVGQDGELNYMIHQFKNFIGANTTFGLAFSGESTLAPYLSTVYLQIFNHQTGVWDTVDSNSVHPADVTFDLKAKNLSAQFYANTSNVISVRVYQLAI